MINTVELESNITHTKRFIVISSSETDTDKSKINAGDAVRGESFTKNS